ncbi:Serine/threonine-protein kinase rio1 [Camellia lanceoleosa]|uniref:Serine/threonine-protein kinase rio1 n=1 Tax=Camellia lanceoleosa TaxID=1840588 RepID=A0ACC0I6V9_9ERIC|nr:Serine/threonine-protein kinase rio1 [Camellia lanceoleosa]
MQPSAANNSIAAAKFLGSEANVYHATKSDGQELAIKVYKTSVLVFKDRDRYVQGDYRFRHGYCRHNPRKMVKTYEKEMRNLKRLKAAGIRCPTPLLLRLHVLVMEFICIVVLYTNYHVDFRGDVISQEDEIADSVFVQSFIPKTLDSVKNVEEDIDLIL